MFKFIHAADVHLDSPLKGLARYEGAPAQRIRSATRRALERLVQVAIDEAVAFVVFAGDIFDGDWRELPWRSVRDTVLSSCERTYFVDQLRRAAGNIDQTARLCGVNPRSLYDLMKRHGLKKEDYRE